MNDIANNQTNILFFIEIARFGLQFGVIPVIIGIWKLNNSVNNLTVTLHKDFATKKDLDKKQNKRGT